MYTNKNCELPVLFCRHCNGEIYRDDIIYNLEDIYKEGTHIVHEDCLVDSLMHNKELAMDFFFEDISTLQDILENFLYRYVAWEFLHGLGDNDDWR